ncbi:5'-3' exoribonuclease 2 [Coemansia sp. Benny D115]|nr:5'-3' exoribonuclease 2 [Coemansia sp. Benny D115]
MGVAAFYRWLTKKYPKVETRVVEERPYMMNGVEVPVDATQPNPNGREFDNLYLDMNGIVHPCAHPQFGEAPKTEEAMMVAVFDCLDRVFRLIRPRKLVYMALDGVAPRAKMNQQRARRFRAAQEADEKRRDEQRVAEEVFQATGVRQPEAKKPWDSNCITPGTPFMELLAKSLRYYIAMRLNSDPAWKNVKVLLSDSNVPGEGEHKIMDYIRRQRVMPAYDPNTSHVLYGLDADLIMLSLATHEPYFKILRDDVTWAQNLSRPCKFCKKTGHFSRSCRGPDADTPAEDMSKQPFVFANIEVLREYLEFDLKPTEKMSFPFDLERAIDDWVFLCFFVGNDFLPHMPSLEIREGAIDLLVKIWKSELPRSGGYITRSGEVDLFRLQPIIDKVAAREADAFKARKQSERRAQKKKDANFINGNDRTQDLDAAADQMAALNAASARRALEQKQKADASNHAAANALKAKLAAKRTHDQTELEQDEDEEMVSGNVAVPGAEDASASDPKRVKLNDGGKASAAADGTGSLENNNDGVGDDNENDDDDDDDDDESNMDSVAPSDADSKVANSGAATATESETPREAEEVVDDVKLYEPGYRSRYYNLKFHIAEDDKKEINLIAEHYVRGLCWVLRYYYQGCGSWNWYYPYHYAPLASDLVDVDMMDTSFEMSAPLRPYEQLMSVLPASSRHNLPKPFGHLMTSPDSPIIDFYPTDFPLDLNGKKFLWQAVILLPFIDPKRLLEAVVKEYPKLTPEEVIRNQLGQEILVVSSANTLYESLCSIYSSEDPAARVPLNPRLSDRMSGEVSADPNYVVSRTKFESPLHSVGLSDIDDDRTVSVTYHQPVLESPHASVLLAGLDYPIRILNDADYAFVASGSRGGNNGPGRPNHRENNRDFRDFYRQQGNDVSQDRGRGPKRYDERGNVNPEYQDYYSNRNQSSSGYDNSRRGGGNYGGGRHGNGGHRGDYRGGHGHGRGGTGRPPFHSHNSYRGGGHGGSYGGGRDRYGGGHNSRGGYAPRLPPQVVSHKQLMQQQQSQQQSQQQPQQQPQRPIGYSPFAGGARKAAAPAPAPGNYGHQGPPPQGRPPSRPPHNGYRRGGY